MDSARVTGFRCSGSNRETTTLLALRLLMDDSEDSEGVEPSGIGTGSESNREGDSRVTDRADSALPRWEREAVAFCSRLSSRLVRAAGSSARAEEEEEEEEEDLLAACFFSCFFFMLALSLFFCSLLAMQR